MVSASRLAASEAGQGRRQPEWLHKIEIVVPGSAFVSSTIKFKTWLDGWKIPHRIFEGIGAVAAIQLSFQLERHAGAFQLQYDGRFVVGDERQRALTRDAADENLFEQLAPDFRTDVPSSQRLLI
jgi:hypothetical protein